MTRLDDQYMARAHEVAQQGTCDRARVGCILTLPLIGEIGRGYNTAPMASPTCDDEGHLMHDGHCVRTTHAEIYAIAQAAAQEIGTGGATAYLTHAPCIGCAHALIAHGITRIVYADAYRINETTRYVLSAAGVNVEEWSQ
jgi:dCMP deaminase